MEKIYAAANPMWYADTFIFSYMKDFGCYVYVKVNSDNKIEEIGINLERRMHNTRFEDMNKTEASELQKSVFNIIGEEYWWGLHNQYKKKKKEYPKTYKDCCDVLGLDTMDNDAQGYKWLLIIRLQELLIARDAYWKIAGEEIGLGKSWEPDWMNENQYKYCIYNNSSNTQKGEFISTNAFLAFPTAEMRDAFYDNFKKLIENCKELL